MPAAGRSDPSTSAPRTDPPPRQRSRPRRLPSTNRRTAAATSRGRGCTSLRRCLEQAAWTVTVSPSKSKLTGLDALGEVRPLAGEPAEGIGDAGAGGGLAGVVALPLGL